MAKEGKIVISLDFSDGFDADLIFHSILISKSKQVSLSQDCAHKAVTRNDKEANWRQEKATTVMTLLWVFLRSHWGENLTSASSFGRGCQQGISLSITVRECLCSLNMFEIKKGQKCSMDHTDVIQRAT